MANDVYTAGMGQPPMNDDMGSIEALRGKRPMPAPAMPRRPMAPPMAAKRPMADPADAGIYTADKGMPPSPDEGPTMMRRRPKKMASGGSVSSASKRADGIAKKGKTKGKFV